MVKLVKLKSHMGTPASKTNICCFFFFFWLFLFLTICMFCRSDKELYAWVRCVKNQPHDFKNLMPTQIVPETGKHRYRFVYLYVSKHHIRFFVIFDCVPDSKSSAMPSFPKYWRTCRGLCTQWEKSLESHPIVPALTAKPTTPAQPLPTDSHQ